MGSGVAFQHFFTFKGTHLIARYFSAGCWKVNGVRESAGITGLEMRMKESYKENLASDSGHEPYAGSGDAPGVASSFGNSFAEAMAVKKATAGQVGKWRRRPVIELRNQSSRVPTLY